MPDPAPDVIPGLPTYIQAIFAAAVFIGGIIAGVIGYKKRVDAPEAPPKHGDFAVMGGALAERFAADRLSAAIEAAVVQLKRVADHLEREAERGENRQAEMLKDIHDRLTAPRNRPQR